MDKFRNFFRKHMPSKRRVIQLYAAVLYNAHAKGFLTGEIYTGKIKAVCVPGLNCYSCPGAVGACPLGALQNAIASVNHRLPYYVFGILLLYGLILGRTVCGFLCPFGMLQELAYKLPTRKIKKGRVTKVLSKLKYVILLGFVILVPLYNALKHYPLPAFCKYICPAGTLEGAVMLIAHPQNSDILSMLGALFTSKLTILICITVLCVFLYRAFCRFLCPLGLIYGLFNRISFVGVKVNAQKCVHCDKCVRHCLLDVKKVGDTECIQCGECISVCPTGAIDLKAGKIVLKAKDNEQTASGKRAETVKRISAWVMAAVLLSVIVFSNLPGKNPSANADASDFQAETAAHDPAAYTVDMSLPAGKEDGCRAEDFTLPVLGADEAFTLSSQLGKTVVINFWATWCGPCVKELPHFDSAYLNGNGDVIVLAVHSNLVTDDPAEYLSQFNYQMPFAVDATGEVADLLGVTTMLPHTIIVDKNGVIVYNQVGSLMEEELMHQILAAKGDVE